MAQLRPDAIDWSGYGGAGIAGHDPRPCCLLGPSVLRTDGARPLPTGATIGPLEFHLVSPQIDCGAQTICTTWSSRWTTIRGRASRAAVARFSFMSPEPDWHPLPAVSPCRSQS